MFFCFILDPRTKDWPLMSSPFPTLVICLGYVYLVKVSNKICFKRKRPKIYSKISSSTQVSITLFENFAIRPRKTKFLDSKLEFLPKNSHTHFDSSLKRKTNKNFVPVYQENREKKCWNPSKNFKLISKHAKFCAKKSPRKKL